jgi:hypothetical protein
MSARPGPVESLRQVRAVESRPPWTLPVEWCADGVAEAMAAFIERRSAVSS